MRRRPLAVFGIFLGLWAACASRAGQPMPAREADAVDVLVFAPHPDDEVLNCAGVMLQALAQNRRVAVVVLTHGDGFIKATAALKKRSPDELTPADFLDLADLRQQQSIDSMAVIGGKRADLIFLGYPNGGLEAIYKSSQSPQSQDATPFTLPYTGKNETYGRIAVDYHTVVHGRPAPYVKASIVGDLVEIIRKRKPNRIFVTHEADSHADHKASFWFVRDAARAAGYTADLYTYIGHGDAKPALPIVRVDLSPAEVEKKRASVRLHRLPVVHETMGDEVGDHEIFWLFKEGGVP